MADVYEEPPSVKVKTKEDLVAFFEDRLLFLREEKSKHRKHCRMTELNIDLNTTLLRIVSGRSQLKGLQ